MDAMTPSRKDHLDREALFEDALTRYGPGLMRVARSYTRHPQTQEDLQQEVALALWRALARFQHDCSLRTFVFRVAHNCCISKVYRKRQEPRSIDNPEQMLSQLTDPRHHPDEQVAQQQRSQQLYRAIQELALNYRQVLTLALEELPHHEIAAVLGISESNVAVRLNRARKMLRTKLQRRET